MRTIRMRDGLNPDFPYALHKTQKSTKRSFRQRKPGSDWKKIGKELAKLWIGKKITKKAHAGREHEIKWEISNKTKRIIETPWL
jgi:hypothetical protein